MSLANNPDRLAGAVMLGLAVTTAAGALLARALRGARQPSVMGEIMAGLVLGPSVLGLLPGDLPHVLFPDEVRPYLSVLARIGLVFFMFSMGAELTPERLRRVVRPAVPVSLGSVLVPFASGCALALALYQPHHVVDGHTINRLAFTLFIGVALSITAFPVLARILTDYDVHRTPLGAFAMSCAAISDLIAWWLLALALAVIKGNGNASVLLFIVAITGFTLALFYAVRPALDRFLRSSWCQQQPHGPFVAVAVTLLLVVAVSAWLDINPIFAAFLFGVAAPIDAIHDVAPEVPLRLEQTGYIFLPAFFALTGLKVDLAGLDGSTVLQGLAITAVACASKLLGTRTAARLSGVPPRRATVLGVLMNTRGITELVVILLGAQLGILDTQLTTVLVMMAVITTLMTGPLFKRLDQPEEPEPAANQWPAGLDRSAADATPAL